MPDETTIQETIDGNMRRNAELLTILREKKVALNKERSIEFHYWAWSESDAAALRNALNSNGATAKDALPVEEEDERVWSVNAEVITTPELAGSLEQTRVNTILAAKLNCVYDGWGLHL